MNTLVIGGSGHIGNAVVRLLLEHGHNISACGRRKETPINLQDLRIRYVVGDAESPGQFDKWVQGHDLVVDAAAPYPLGVFPSANAQGDLLLRAETRTQRLLDAVARHNVQLAYVSSCITLAQPRTNAQKFQAKLMRTVLPYFDVKQLIETLIIDAGRRGISAVIINPTYCLGPWDIRERRYCMIPLLVRGEIPGSISKMLHVIDVRDVAAALLAAIDNKRHGQPILVSSFKIQAHDLYSKICEIAGVPAPRLRFPAEPVLAGAYFLELISGAAGLESPLSSGALMISTVFDCLEPAEELKKLDITPRPLSKTITDSIKWYREIGYC